jgi:hypothetical protein
MELLRLDRLGKPGLNERLIKRLRDAPRRLARRFFFKNGAKPLLVEAQLESVFLRELFDLCFPIFLV